MKKGFRSILLAAVMLVALLTPPALGAEAGKTLVRVGMFPYPASVEIHDGKYTGFTYDYLMEIAKYTGWQYEFVDADFATCHEMLKNGELDLVGGLQKDSAREEIFDFPEISYGETYSDLFTTADSPLQAFDYASFDGMQVGIVKGTLNDQYFAEFAREHGFTYEMTEYASAQELNDAVSAGEVDGGILLNNVDSQDTRILARFAPKSVYIVTTKGNQEILDGLNKALYSIKVNSPLFAATLYEKYYAATDDPRLTAEEALLVKASRENPVVVGVVDNSAPISFFNEETGAFEGIAVDILAAVSEKTGLQFRLVPVDLSRRENASSPNENSPQLVLGVTKAEQLPDTRGWRLTNGAFTDSFAIVSEKGRNISAEAGEKTLAVMENFDMTYVYAAQNMPEYTIAEYPTLQDCMEAVVRGEADAAVYLHSCISYLLQRPRFDKLEIMPTYSMSVDICAAGFTPGSQVYVDIVNKGLQRVTEAERRTIVLNSTVGNPYIPTLEDTLYKYRAPLLVIVVLVLSVMALLTALYLQKRKGDKQVREALAMAELAGAAKGNFMSRMSHEIRTPLNAVIGYNTLARNEMTEAKTEAQRRSADMKVMDCLTKSDIASRHLLTIINDVLDISAIESGKIRILKERFDFKGLISSLTAIFYSQAKAKGVNFDVRFSAQMDEWVVGDQLRLNQILTNLLSNAVKFTPEGGQVTLLIQPQSLQEEVKLHFEVRDTGIGMAPDYMQHIWTPFEQADSSISRRFGGTGLGLSITKNLVDLLGGTIGVESSLGKGSTFMVNLTMERTAQPEDQGAYDFSSIHALIVDDDLSTCDYIRLLLTRSGVRSAAVNSGEEAIHAVRAAIAEKSPYTVCLVDWRMPKMDGLETVRQIRAIAGADLPIIVITAYDFTEVADKAAEVGVNRFISKPLFQSSLFNLLANISGSPVPKNTDKLAAFDFAGARVLLAEDNVMNMEIAGKILESAKLTVECAWNGQEAVDKFMAAPAGTYKAILMDVQMPVMDGYEATKIIRASRHPEAATIPIIAMTADAFAENIAESHSAGMNDHVSKPIDLPSLFQTLRSFIE